LTSSTREGTDDITKYSAIAAVILATLALVITVYKVFFKQNRATTISEPPTT
jgi:uncharacterized membrane protein YukC